MADRVAIIGGSTVGRDHFPFPAFTPSDPSMVGRVQDGLHPFGFVIEDCCYAFFRVKTWRIDVDLTRDDSPSPPHTLNLSINAPAGAVFDTGAEIVPGYARESDLVVPRQTISTSGPSNTFAIFLDSSEDISSMGRIVYAADTLLYPYFGLQLDSASGPASTTDATNNAAADMTFLGQSFTLYAFDANWSGTVDIYPIEYWPYATKAGDPVYDTGTGAQLADPFS